MRSKVTFIFHVEFNLPIASYHIPDAWNMPGKWEIFTLI